MPKERLRKSLSIYIKASMVKDLVEAAEPRKERDPDERRSGKPPGPATVAAELFEAAWPLFVECGMDKSQVTEAVMAILGKSRKKGNQGR